MKIKRPYDVALAAALEVMDLLRPACERIELAGSLRRECAEVGDIEICAIPRYTLDMLGEPDGLEVDDLLDSSPIYTLHKNGPRYKQFSVLACAAWHQVDLFLATPDNWGYILMLRTGPADFSKTMVTPQPYGFKPSGINVRDGNVYSYPANERLSVPTEEELFALWGMAYIQPQERK